MEAESKKQNESSNSETSGFGLSPFDFKLKIGYDGKRAANNLTGLGNYSRSLIRQLAAQFPSNSYFVYTPKAKNSVVQLPVFSLPNVKLVLPATKEWLWRTFGIKKQLQKDHIQLFHGLSHEIPYGLSGTGIKTVVTMHDLIFLRRPQHYKWIDRQIYRLKSEYACKHADRIIAISDKTKSDIVELYHIDPSKIDVVYQSCDDSFKTPMPVAELDQIKKKYSLPSVYLLYVGTIESRKNLLALIRALPQVQTSVKLVVVGRATSYEQLVKTEIEKLKLRDRVIFLNVSYADLPGVYQLATTFVLPSYYEGFGIPIIEALYCKVPVIAAKGSCLEEAGGPNSLYFAPDDINELAKLVDRILNDPELAETMRKKGFDYVQRFNSEEVNQQLIACYHKTLSS